MPIDGWKARRPQPEPNASILVAVYGTLRRGGGLHHYYLTQSPCIGKGTVSHAQIYCLGACPGVIQRPDMPDSKVVVEVYKVDHTTLHNLDSLEGFYDRVLIPFTLDNGKKGEAYMYTITDDDLFSGMELIPHGDWMRWDSENPFLGGMLNAPKVRYVMKDEDGNLVDVPPEWIELLEKELAKSGLSI